MRSEEKAAIAVGAFALMALLLLSEPPARAESRPEKLPVTPPPTTPPPSGESTDDETALARMLRSETGIKSVWPVIGWMTIYTARSQGKTVYDRLTDRKGYGPRVKDGVSRYASTAREPSAESRAAARALLRGELLPSARIRAFGHSSWVEILTSQESEAESLLRKQEGKAKWGGVWARLRGTNWYLLNPSAPPVKWAPGAARAALAKVPVLDSTDPLVS